MEEKKRCIYLHVNKVNGKVYVGQTIHQDNLTRRTYTDGSGYKNIHSKFWRAIQKYGWDNFEHFILEKDIPTLELANEREQYWINFYDSYNNGYNSTLGGDGTKGRIFTDEEKEYRSKLYSGSGNPMYGKSGELAPAYGRKWSDEQKRNLSKICTGRKMSDETKQKLSDIKRGFFTGENNPFYNKHHSDEVRKMLSDKAKKQMKNNPIYDYERTDSIREQISCTLKEYYKTHNNPRKGKHWDEEHKKRMSDSKKNDKDAMKRITQLGKDNIVSVNQYDMNGLYIATFKSILEASQKTETSYDTIIRCCNGKAKSAGGYQWRYIKEHKQCENISPVKYSNNYRPMRKVAQYDKDMNLIKIWESISEASKELGLQCSGIIEVCKQGKQKTCGGYIWRYADEIYDIKSA